MVSSSLNKRGCCAMVVVLSPHYVNSIEISHKTNINMGNICH